MLGSCPRRLRTSWLRAGTPPGSNLLLFWAAGVVGSGRWEKIPEATQLRVDPALRNGGVK